MLFDVYGTNAPFQWLCWGLVFVGLILAHESRVVPRLADSSCSAPSPSP